MSYRNFRKDAAVLHCKSVTISNIKEDSVIITDDIEITCTDSAFTIEPVNLTFDIADVTSWDCTENNVWKIAVFCSILTVVLCD